MFNVVLASVLLLTLKGLPELHKVFLSSLLLGSQHLLVDLCASLVPFLASLVQCPDLTLQTTELFDQSFLLSLIWLFLAKV